MTREESIQCGGNKININFGASVDPGGVNMVDNIQVWVKTKESFCWPEDTEEYSTTGGVSTSQPTETDGDTGPSQPLPLTPVDNVVVSTLETLDASLAVCEPAQVTESALEVATRLLVAPAWRPSSEPIGRSCPPSIPPGRPVMLTWTRHCSLR